MNRFKKKFLALGLATTLLFSVGVKPVDAGDYTDNLILKYDGEIYKYTQRLITVEIDGQEMKTGDMPAVLIDSRTMVPVREVFESDSINATVNWNGTTQQVFISYEDKFIVLTIDSDIAYVNNKAVELSVPAKLIQDMSRQYSKTMIPLRFVSENLGFDVTWDGDSFTAGINTGKTTSGGNSGETVTTPEDDTKEDPSVVSGEQLDKLEGSEANRPLPTPLLSQPVVFNPKDDVEVVADPEAAVVEIEAKNYAKTYVDDVDAFAEGLETGFYIHTSGPVSDVQTHVWNGKFIIEVHNSGLDLAKTTIDYADNPIVTAIRTGEHETDDGVPYAKIVFDLKSAGYKFRLELDDDRDKLKVTALDSSVSKVELRQNTNGDYIDITGVNATAVEAFRLSNPTRIVFDMPNTKTLLGYQTSEAEGQYVTAIRTAQFEETIARIVIETDGQPDYQILDLGDGSTRIQILEPGYENISYDNTDDNPTIIIDNDGNEDIAINKITYEDDYLNRKYTITIPGDQREHFGSGVVNINDSVIDNINVKLVGGNTEIVIKAKTIHEFRIEASGSALVIKAYKPHELYEKVIVVDAGHGGDDPGAVVGQWFEKYTTLGTTLELKKILDQEEDMKVYYTRLVDSRPSLYERTDLANEVEADFFLSIHINSFTSNYNGVETLYLPGPNTPGLNAFEMAAIFQKVFSDNVAIEDYLSKQRDNLHVLNATDMPAIILEMGYLTNAHDRQYLTDEDYYDDLARAIKMAIDETFRQHPTGR